LEEVAKYVGVARPTILKYETGVISNIPSDKIERLSEILGVTPAYLMGWETSESWETIFRRNFAAEIDKSNWADVEAVGLSEDEVQSIITGKETISLERAGDLAEKLGVKLDYLIDRDNYIDKSVTDDGDGLSREISHVFSGLSEENQKQLIAYARFLATQGQGEEV
jgi:transcriptional regulator with XRE-family HTH domain